MKTAPRLPDGTPFPTLYYLTDPRLTSAASRLESSGVMKEMSQRLADDEELAAAYRRAHEGYLAERDAIESLGTDFSGGGMPDRVKCLRADRALAGQRAGVNPLGDEAVALACDDGLRGTALPADWPSFSSSGDEVVTQVDGVRFDTSRRRRLRDEFDPSADRRRCRGTRRSETARFAPRDGGRAPGAGR